jgi:hypothetical protein
MNNAGRALVIFGEQEFFGENTPEFQLPPRNSSRAKPGLKLPRGSSPTMIFDGNN